MALVVVMVIITTVMITVVMVCECRSHGELMALNGQLMEALQLYHNLMRELPSYGYSTMSLPPTRFSGPMVAPPQLQPPSYMSLNQVG